MLHMSRNGCRRMSIRPGSCLLVAMLMVTLSVQASRADAVFYCVEEIITGFIKDSGGWRLGKFKPKRYMIKIEGDWEALVHGDQRYDCFVSATIDEYKVEPVMCKHSEPWMTYAFNIDKLSLRFVHTRTSAAGYASDLPDPDTDVFAGGQCERF